MITRIWTYISLLQTEKKRNKLKVHQIQLLNQYNFLLACIFFINAIRDLFFGLYYSFFILIAFGAFLLITLFFTKIRLNAVIVFLFCCLLTLFLFYFSSFAGFRSGVFMYNFALLSAILFIFDIQYKKYTISIYVLVFILFIVNYLTNFELFFNPIYNNPQFHQNVLITTFIQTFLITGLNGIYLYKKNYIIIKVYKQKIRKLIITQNLTGNLTIDEKLQDIEELVSMAIKDDIAFIPKFNTMFPTFHNSLLALNPKMTSNEYKFCALLKLKFSTKDISEYNYITVRTVQTRKNRLRKSFNLSPDTDLYLWIEQLQIKHK